MTEQEIQTRLDELAAQMVDKGVKLPRAEITLKSGGQRQLAIWSCTDQRAFGGDYLEIFSRGTTAEAIDAAAAYIAAMPDPQDAVTQEYLRRVSGAIDYATEHSLPEEYVAPLRGVTKAMTDNLLTHRGEGA